MGFPWDSHGKSHGSPMGGTIHWAYTHQHNGATNATFSINGAPVCTSYPHIGHNAHDPVGDEKGYLVGFRMCVDPILDTPIKVKKGDKISLTAYASVDSTDTRYAYPWRRAHWLHGSLLLLL